MPDHERTPLTGQPNDFDALCAEIAARPGAAARIAAQVARMNRELERRRQD